MRVLIDDADMAGAEHAPLIAGEVEQIAVLAVRQAQPVVAGIGRVFEVHHAQKRGLSRTAFPDNAHDFAGIDRGVHVAQGAHIAKAPGDVVHGQKRSCPHQARGLALKRGRREIKAHAEYSPSRYQVSPISVGAPSAC